VKSQHGNKLYFCKLYDSSGSKEARPNNRFQFLKRIKIKSNDDILQSMTAPKEQSSTRSFFSLFQVPRQWSVLKDKRACKLSFDLKAFGSGRKTSIQRERARERETTNNLLDMV
jgi:hypothetical protein